MRRSIVSNLEESENTLERLINIRPINEATKSDVAGVNYLIKKNLKTPSTIVEEAIATGNPTIMWLVARFVEGISEEQKNKLNAIIKSSKMPLLYRETTTKNNNAGSHLSSKELKNKKRQARINNILNKYRKASIEELIHFNPDISPSKKNVCIINYLLRKGLKTVDEVVNEAISTNNIIILLMIAKYVDSISDEQKNTLLIVIKRAIKKLKIEEMITFSPVNMYASKNNVKAINDLLHEGLKTVDGVVEEAIASDNPKVMYYVAMFVDGITEVHIGMLTNAINKKRDSLEELSSVVMHNLAINIPSTAQSLSKGVVRTERVSDMVSYARAIPSAPIDYLAKNIIKYSQNEEDAMSIYYFVRDHLERLTKDFIASSAKKVISLKNPSAICSFASFGGATIEEYIAGLEEAVKNKNDMGLYLYLFALQFRNVDATVADKVGLILVESSDYEYIFKYLRDIEISESLTEEFINKLFTHARNHQHSKCGGYLAKLALENKPYSERAVLCLIDLGNAFLIDLVMQKIEDEYLAEKLREALASLEDESISDLGEENVSPMKLVRENKEDDII